MRDAAAIRLMLGDPAWELLDRVTDPARLVSGYLRDHDDLIPDRLPVLARLDDAIVVKALAGAPRTARTPSCQALSPPAPAPTLHGLCPPDSSTSTSTASTRWSIRRSASRSSSSAALRRGSRRWRSPAARSCSPWWDS